jgi:hypothetical protein
LLYLLLVVEKNIAHYDDDDHREEVGVKVGFVFNWILFGEVSVNLRLWRICKNQYTLDILLFLQKGGLVLPLLEILLFSVYFVSSPDTSSRSERGTQEQKV